MSRIASILESFPAEKRLASPDSIQAFRAGYDWVHGFMGALEFESRLREAGARGLIAPASRRRRRLTPISLPGRPLCEFLKEVRE